MRRREFLAGIGGSAVCAHGLGAQQARVHRVAVLMTTQRDRVWHLAEALHNGLRALGYQEGRNIVFDYRFAEGRMERIDGLAAELVALEPDVIVVGPNTSVIAAMRASKIVPIVGTVINEPVASGIVKSLSQPGGNVTGLSADVTAETWGLRVQFLMEMTGSISCIGVLWNPEVLGVSSSWSATQDAAERFGVRVVPYQVRNIQELGNAFERITSDGAAQALLVFADGLTYARRREIIAFADRARLPDLYALKDMVTDGGLASYGYDLVDAYRRSAGFVDKIIKGQPPGDLPVELPTKLELVLNLRTAKTRGIAIPPTLLARADEVIE